MKQSISPGLQNYFYKWKSKIRDDRDRFIVDNLKLATHMARRYNPKTPEQLEDYIQIANIGLIKSYDSYDPNRGDRHSHICFKIRAEFHNFFRGKYYEAEHKQRKIQFIPEIMGGKVKPKYEYINLTKLTDKQKYSVIQTLSGFTQKEIAKERGVSHNAIQSTLEYAVKKLTCVS